MSTNWRNPLWHRPGVTFAGVRARKKVRSHYRDLLSAKAEEVHQAMLNALGSQEDRERMEARQVFNEKVIPKIDYRCIACVNRTFTVMSLSKENAGSVASLETLTGTASLVASAMKESGYFDLSVKGWTGLFGCKKGVLRASYVPDAELARATQVLEEIMQMTHPEDAWSIQNPFAEVAVSQLKDQEQVSGSLAQELSEIFAECLPVDLATSLQAKNDRLEVWDLLKNRVIPQAQGGQDGYFKVMELSEVAHLSVEVSDSSGSPSLDDLGSTAALISEVLLSSGRFILKIYEVGRPSDRSWALHAKRIS